MDELFELSQELSRAGENGTQSSMRSNDSMPRISESLGKVDPKLYIPTANQLGARLVAIRARFQHRSDAS